MECLKLCVCVCVHVCACVCACVCVFVCVCRGESVDICTHPLDIGVVIRFTCPVLRYFKHIQCFLNLAFSPRLVKQTQAPSAWNVRCWWRPGRLWHLTLFSWCWTARATQKVRWQWGAEVWAPCMCRARFACLPLLQHGGHSTIVLCPVDDN